MSWSEDDLEVFTDTITVAITIQTEIQQEGPNIHGAASCPSSSSNANMLDWPVSHTSHNVVLSYNCLQSCELIHGDCNRRSNKLNLRSSLSLSVVRRSEAEWASERECMCLVVFWCLIQRLYLTHSTTPSPYIITHQTRVEKTQFFYKQ